MANLVRCPQGHQWDQGHTDSAATCPTCGAAALDGRNAASTEAPPGDTIAFQRDQHAAPPVPEHSRPPLDAASAMTGDHSRPPLDGAAAAPPPPPERDSSLDRINIRGYEIFSELGRGGMGVVYKAKQTNLGRLVALKMVLAGVHAKGEELDRFRIEAEAVARLQHPNIVQIYEIGEEDGRPYFSLEYVDGGSLEDKLDGSPQHPKQAAQLVQTLARAVHAAHTCGIIHRDLKPANILLTKDGQPKITDFGLAKRLDSTHGHTQTGDIMGTPDYMAPEQAAGRIKMIGPCTDIYALGAILYDMLTGRPPFQAASILEALEQVRTREPVPLTQLQPNLPRDLETICLKCLQKEPFRRYGTALELAEDIERFLNNEPIRARPVGKVERAVRWCRRNPVVAGLLGMLSLLFIGLMIFSVMVWNEATNQYYAMALQGTGLQAKTFVNLREQYSDDVVARAKTRGVPIAHDFRDKDGAIPLPATLVMELGQRITKDRPGANVRLYSDYPFPWRTGSSAIDDFERQALDELRRNPDQPYYVFAEKDGIPVLRYAIADKMHQSCVNCHNSHPASPKTDWKVGDVRGVLEIVRPLDDKVAENRRRLKWLLLVPAVLGAVPLLAGLSYFVNRRLRS